MVHALQDSGRKDGGRCTHGIWDQGFGGCLVRESSKHLGNLEVG